MKLPSNPVLRRIVLKKPEDTKDFVQRIKTGVIKLFLKDPKNGEKINLYLVIDMLKIIGVWLESQESSLFGEEALKKTAPLMSKPKLAEYYLLSQQQIEQILSQEPQLKTTTTYLVAPFLNNGQLITPEHKEKISKIFSAVRALSEENIPTKVDLKNVPPTLKGYANSALINIVKALHKEGLTPQTVELEFEEKRTLFRGVQKVINVRVKGVPNKENAIHIIQDQLKPILRDINTLAGEHVTLGKIDII